MKPHEQILKLIEEVDQNDTAKLDEIDELVELYVVKLETTRDEIGRRIYILNKGTDHESKCYVYEPAQYTRSRDALKAIRPEGWSFNINNGVVGQDSYGIILHNFVVGYESWGRKFLAGGNVHPYVQSSDEPEFLPTEELAELHAIVQAIAYERGE